MTEPIRPPRVLQAMTPEQQQLASDKRRREEMRDTKLEDALEKEAKDMLFLHCEKVSERVARFKAIALFLAIKNKLAQPFGGALDNEEEAS